MRLIFSTEDGRWFLSDEEQWFSVEEEREVDLLATILPVEILGGSSGATRFLGGRAVIGKLDPSSPQAVVPASLHDSSARHLRYAMLPITNALLRRARWTEGAYSDGWIAPVADLTFEGLAELQIKLSLPKLSRGAGKKLRILVDGQEWKSMLIPRNDQPSLISWSGRRHAEARIQLIAEYAERETASDPRARGFFVADLLVDGASVYLSSLGPQS